MDYFQWNVLRTEDGLFDPDSYLKMTTGRDSKFPDEISMFMNVDSSGKALNFRGNVNPIIGPATSNSGVSKTNSATGAAYTTSSATPLDIDYRFSEGATVGSFISLALDDTTTPTANVVTVDLEFKGVSEDGNVILSPGTPTPNPAVIDGQTLSFSYDPKKGTLTASDATTGKAVWTYSDFNFQTTEINGAKYLVDYSNSAPAGAGVYGDRVTFWGPTEMGTMDLFQITAAAVPAAGVLSYAGGVYAGSQEFTTKFAGGVTVTAKPSPTDPTKLIFTYDSTDGGKPVSSIRENSGSVHEGKGTIYDSLGNAHTLEVAWKKVGNNAWSWEAFFPDSPEIKLSDNKGVLRFSSEGKILTGGENTISVAFSAIGAEDADIVLDFSGKSFDKDEIDGVTQYGSAFTTKPYYQ
ncbi:MAG: hypothetical protein EOM02_13590, partial [Synergistales bacterium]|nr:hypothetical protein [Synergistales bacterium]